MLATPKVSVSKPRCSICCHQQSTNLLLGSRKHMPFLVCKKSPKWASNLQSDGLVKHSHYIMQDAFLQQVYRKMQVDNKTKRGHISIFIHRVNNKPDMVGSIKIQEQVDAVETWTPQMIEVVVCLHWSNIGLFIYLALSQSTMMIKHLGLNAHLIKAVVI